MKSPSHPTVNPKTDDILDGVLSQLQGRSGLLTQGIEPPSGDPGATGVRSSVAVRGKPSIAPIAASVQAFKAETAPATSRPISTAAISGPNPPSLTGQSLLSAPTAAAPRTSSAGLPPARRDTGAQTARFCAGGQPPVPLPAWQPALSGRDSTRIGGRLIKRSALQDD